MVQIEDLGRAIINLCLVIPHGVVCFFPSYAYLDFVISQWQRNTSSGNGKSIWERLADRKTVFNLYIICKLVVIWFRTS